MFGKVYHFHFLTTIDQVMNPSSHCRTSIFEEEFKFQYVRGEIHNHVATQNIISTFLSKWHFAWHCKYRSVP